MCRFVMLCLLIFSVSAHAGFGTVWGPIPPREREPDVIDIAIVQAKKVFSGIAEKALESLGWSYVKRELISPKAEDDPRLAKLGTEEALRQQKFLQAKVDEGEILDSRQKALLENLNRVFTESLEEPETQKTWDFVAVWQAPPSGPEVVCERMKSVVESALADGTVERNELESWVDPVVIRAQNTTAQLRMISKVRDLASRIYGDNEAEQQEVRRFFERYVASPLIILTALFNAPQSHLDLGNSIYTVAYLFDESIEGHGSLLLQFKIINPRELMSYWLSVVRKESVSDDFGRRISDLGPFSGEMEMGDLLGKGATSEVRACGPNLAYKKLIDSSWWSEAFNLAVIHRLRCPNLVGLHSFRVRAPEAGKKHELGIVFERMRATLGDYLKREKHVVLSISQIKLTVSALLKTCAFIHSVGISHNDLKPSNILVSTDGRLKVGDFGLSSWFGLPVLEKRRELVTRWYRAPEALFEHVQASPALDVWSVGCILGELMVGSPVFPGEESNRILGFQMRLLLPERLSAFQKQFPRMNLVGFCEELQKTPSARKERLFKSLGASGMDLLFCLLHPDPQERITGEQALRHPWLSENSTQPPSSGSGTGVPAAACSEKP